MGCHCPSTTWMSVRQSPAAPMRTITSSGLSIFGSSISSTLRLSWGMLSSYLCSLADCMPRSPFSVLCYAGCAVAHRQQPAAQLGLTLDAYPDQPGETQMLHDRVPGNLVSFPESPTPPYKHNSYRLNSTRSPVNPRA